MISQKGIVTGLIYSSVFLASFYQSEKFTDNFLIPKHYAFVFLGSVSILLVFIINFKKRDEVKYNLNLIDLFVLLFTSYLFIRFITNKSSYANDLGIIYLISVTLIYFAFKPQFIRQHNEPLKTNFTHSIFISLSLFAVIHVLFGLLQITGFVENKHIAFTIGGFYGNPGIYANLLVFILPVPLAYACYTPKGLIKRIAIISTVLITAMIVLSMARAAVLAFGILTIYYLMHLPRLRIFFRSRFNTLMKKLLLIIFGIILTLSIAISLYQFKKESATGRFFIWKTTVEMIKDKPVFGHGLASFAVVHNEYQAEYFKENQDDKKNSFYADCVNYAFNEFLQITSETGIIGLLLFLLLLLLPFYNKRFQTPSSSNLPILASEGIIVVATVTSMFSYPLQIVPNMLVLYTALNIKSANFPRILFSFNLPKLVRMGLYLMISFIIVIALIRSFERVKSEKMWLRSIHRIRENNFAEALPVYDNILPVMDYNEYFLFNYGAELSLMGKYDQSIDILNNCSNRINDVDFYIYLGNSYEGIKHYSDALDCFKQASYMVPIKLYPKYRMVLLYDIMGEYDKALDLAKEIVRTPIKVNPDIALDFKKEMLIYISNKEK